MIWNQLEISKDDNNKLYGSFQLNIDEDKIEISYAQKVFNLDGEVSIVPKSAIPILTKYGTDIIEMMKEKYPEDIISDDFYSFVDFIEVIRENKNT